MNVLDKLVFTTQGLLGLWIHSRCDNIHAVLLLAIVMYFTLEISVL